VGYLPFRRFKERQGVYILGDSVLHSFRAATGCKSLYLINGINQKPNRSLVKFRRLLNQPQRQTPMVG